MSTATGEGGSGARSIAAAPSPYNAPVLLEHDHSIFSGITSTATTGNVARGEGGSTTLQEGEQKFRERHGREWQVYDIGCPLAANQISAEILQRSAETYLPKDLTFL